MPPSNSTSNFALIENKIQYLVDAMAEMRQSLTESMTEFIRTYKEVAAQVADINMKVIVQGGKVDAALRLADTHAENINRHAQRIEALESNYAVMKSSVDTLLLTVTKLKDSTDELSKSISKLNIMYAVLAFIGGVLATGVVGYFFEIILVK